METKRMNTGVVAMDGKLWVVGGENVPTEGDETFASVEVFDPDTNTWDQSKADLITCRKAPCVVVVGGQLYAIGGEAANDDYVTSTERYDPQSNSWSVVPSMKLGKRFNMAYAGSSAVVKHEGEE